MTPENDPVPVVMVFAGNDPSGGAGMAADTEALASMGAQVAPVITALTVQDTRNVQDFQAVEADWVISQARAVLEDMPVACFKLGMLGSLANIEAVHTILHDYPDIPVVADPVLFAGGGGTLAEDDVPDALRSLILPLTTLLTPNAPEARALAREADTLDACAQELLAEGCEAVLITGADEPTPDVINSLFANGRLLERWQWPRLDESFHGSGCTLASAIAGLLAQGSDLQSAVAEAQDYVQEALVQGYRPGLGQHIPYRLFWADLDEDDDGDDQDD